MLTLAPTLMFAQVNGAYTEAVKKATAYYEAKDYQKAANSYSEAFAALGGKGIPADRYNAACAWAKAGNNDSAFFNLNRLAVKVKFADEDQLIKDKDLKNLHKDKRWEELLTLVKQNKEKAEASQNKTLTAVLKEVFVDDQSGRMQIDKVSKKYGQNSPESKKLWKQIEEKDSIDLIKVEKILNEFGWLGSDVVGERGNQTLFLVIQHSNLNVQEKYLPMMRAAVHNQKANPSDLALLEDRVAMGEGKKQIYGSQVRFDTSGKFWVSPIEDPDNVDKRRAEVGLQPIAEYLANWNIKWGLEAYKKQLPEIEQREKR